MTLTMKQKAALTNETTQAVYDFICAYDQEWSYPPSISEIAAACYLSPSTALRHLDKLEAKGLIAREPGRARGIKLLRPEEG